MASLEVNEIDRQRCLPRCDAPRECTHRMRSEPTLNDHSELMRTACRPYDVFSFSQSTAMIACCCLLIAIRFWFHCRRIK